ncbi:MAG: hypothetical protein F6K31_42650 [Symploca sp. SIO2G7]|nr:hypothetical protein [Symploca sp. SIO2G7]
MQRATAHLTRKIGVPHGCENCCSQATDLVSDLANQINKDALNGNSPDGLSAGSTKWLMRQ